MQNPTKSRVGWAVSQGVASQRREVKALGCPRTPQGDLAGWRSCGDLVGQRLGVLFEWEGET